MFNPKLKVYCKSTDSKEIFNLVTADHAEYYEAPDGQRFTVRERDTDNRIWSKATPWEDRWIPVADLKEAIQWARNYVPKDIHFHLYITVQEDTDLSDTGNPEGYDYSELEDKDPKVVNKRVGIYADFDDAHKSYTHSRWAASVKWAEDAIIRGAYITNGKSKVWTHKDGLLDISVLDHLQVQGATAA